MRTRLCVRVRVSERRKLVSCPLLLYYYIIMLYARRTDEREQ